MAKTEEKLELITRYFSEFTERQLQQFRQLEDLYKEWNSQINVISRKDEEHLYEKHVLHSLSIAAVFELKKGMRVLDLGTGGGFPGIPLAIFFPEVEFVLADSIGKKIKVVQAVSSALGLENVDARNVRAEEIKDRKFHVVLSRAVAPLKDLLRWSQPLLEKRLPVSVMPTAGEVGELPVPHGLVCLKGGDLAAEIAESGSRPRIMEISEIFEGEAFKEKYILYVPALATAAD